MSGLIEALALASLVPAALNPSLAVAPDSLELALCNGGSLAVPTGGELPGSREAICCAKGCHGDEKRKRGFDRAQ